MVGGTGRGRQSPTLGYSAFPWMNRTWKGFAACTWDETAAGPTSHNSASCPFSPLISPDLNPFSCLASVPYAPSPLHPILINCFQ
ncbi:hypothetical protein BaRGS_00028366 [Batillaria attramentaria]|uniref:Uncharacterized protein n=1 Tax=Batillaria attramentaria TaxID=370345 RepID=A0ABD0K065_9CAEN